VRILSEVKTTILALLVMLAVVGCNIIGPAMYAVHGPRITKVAAEYGDLAGKRVCIWVWADDAVAFDYPQVCLDVANHARFAIGQHVKCTFADPAAVDRFQRSEYQADQLNVVEIGKRFGADVVLFIEIVEFHTRPTALPSLFQGLISSQCAVYDCKGAAQVSAGDRRVWGDRIRIEFPEDRPLNMTEADDLSIRSATLQVFSQSLAKKFYTHRETAGGLLW